MSKLKAVDPKKAEPTKPKVLLYGKPGVGKTWSSLDFPGVYYCDTEGGANLDHYTDKLKASGGMYFGPEQGSQDFKTLIEQVQALATEKHPYKTLVIDSLSKIFNTEISKEAERLGDKDSFGASKKPAIALTRKLINWIDRLDMNVILIAHEKPIWANEKQVGVGPDCWDKLEYELHLCMNIVKMGDSRKAIIKKSRLKQFPDASTLDWSFESFTDKYGKDAIYGAVKQVELATPEQLKEFNDLLTKVKIDETLLDKWLTAGKAETFEEMDSTKMDSIIKMIKDKFLPKP